MCPTGRWEDNTPATKSFATFHISTEYNVGRNAISDKCISSQGKRLKFGYMVINIIFLLKIFLGENKSIFSEVIIGHTFR